VREQLLTILVCKDCQGDLKCEVAERSMGGEIESGTLNCVVCGARYPIVDGIPRFVAPENYAGSFGYQWNEFRREQIDSLNGTQLSARRFFTETTWTEEWMAGKWLLDGGCGAGRFLEVASRHNCQVVGVDLSSAVEAARRTLAERPNVHLVQASIYELPFRPGTFDGCYSIGVVQHTPDPARTMRLLTSALKPGGRLALTIYERKPWTLLYSKYLLRPLTRRMEQRRLLALIKTMMPALFIMTEILFRLPLLGRAFQFLIPVANYVHEPALTWRQRYAWAVLDTFDMLAPYYDQPQTQQEVEQVLRGAGVGELTRLNNGGLNLIGRKL